MENTGMIQGVKTKSLRVLPDERGRLMEILRADDPLFEKFGQVYLTTTYPGIIKAWHFHQKQDDNIVVVKGMLKLVLYDARKSSPTRGEINEFFIGEHGPLLVHVPKNVYHGWKCIGNEEALVINCVTETFDYKNPDEHRLPYNSKKVPYDWAVKMG
jgi:dTDP-4-dehydrorhamnose 3,5-epimerase